MPPRMAGPLKHGGLFCWLVWLGVLSALAGTPSTNAPPADAAALREHLAALVAQPRFRHAQWGIEIVSLDSGTNLARHNADKLFLPASNAKLYTGALALDRLGPEFRIRTSLYARTPPTSGGAVRGDLWLYGRGDPTFAARLHGGDLSRALAPLAEALAAVGVRRVTGDLVADESYFRGPPFGSGWTWDDLQFYYGAEVSALTINDNAVEITVKPGSLPGLPALISLQPSAACVAVSNLTVTTEARFARDLRFVRPLSRNTVFVEGTLPTGDPGQTQSVSVPEPARWFGETFVEVLEQHGIRMGGRVRVTDAFAPDGDSIEASRRVELAKVESRPLRDLLPLMMKPSQNLHAQLLLLQVGRAARAKARPAFDLTRATVPHGSRLTTDEEAGLEAMESFLREAGIAPGEASFEEGSGLSRRDAVTPAATVRLLRFMDRHASAEVFRASLPVAGVDGTLRTRLRDTPAAGNARAKTGTLSGVNTLAGYVTSGAGERFAFSLMLNHYRSTEPDRPARAELDEVVALLASLTWRTQSY